MSLIPGNSSVPYSGSGVGLAWAVQQNPESRPNSIIDHSASGNRLYQNEDGSIGIVTKTPAYIFGEQIKPLVDAICRLSSGGVQALQRGFSLLDKFASKIVMLPVVGATPIADSSDRKKFAQLPGTDSNPIPPPMPNDALTEALETTKNYKWFHFPDSQNPTLGYSERIFIIPIGVPYHFQGREFQRQLVHYDPKKYSHVFEEYKPPRWFHDLAKRLSYCAGKVTLFDPDQEGESGENGSNILVNGNLIILSSIQFHSNKEEAFAKGKIRWQQEGCLTPYQKFVTKTFWEKPDGDRYDTSAELSEQDFEIDGIKHVTWKNYPDYSHQILQLAVNDHPLMGYKLIQEKYEMTERNYPYLAVYKLKKNNDELRTCIREKKIFIVPNNECPFFGTNIKQFVFKTVDVVGTYLYRDEKDISWSITPYKNMRYYYSRCKDAIDDFEPEQVEYQTKLPHSKTEL